jgi:hypothetical protein
VLHLRTSCVLPAVSSLTSSARECNFGYSVGLIYG